VRTIGQDALANNGNVEACPEIVDGTVMLTCTNTNELSQCILKCGAGGPNIYGGEQQKCHVLFNVTEINSFYACYGVTSISFSSSVHKIGSYTFYNCWNLDNVDIPDTVLELGDYALPSTIKGCFKYNANVTRVTGYSSLPINTGTCTPSPTSRPSKKPTTTTKMTSRPSKKSKKRPIKKPTKVVRKLLTHSPSRKPTGKK